MLRTNLKYKRFITKITSINLAHKTFNPQSPLKQLPLRQQKSPILQLNTILLKNQLKPLQLHPSNIPHKKWPKRSIIQKIHKILQITKPKNKKIRITRPL